MAYVDLEYLKKQLNIESSFTDDDAYIISLEGAAEEVVEKYLDYPLKKYEDNDGKLPKALVHAISLWVSTNYAIRESISNVNLTETPHSLELIISLFKDYKINKE